MTPGQEEGTPAGCLAGATHLPGSCSFKAQTPCRCCHQLQEGAKAQRGSNSPRATELLGSGAGACPLQGACPLPQCSAASPSEGSGSGGEGKRGGGGGGVTGRAEGRVLGGSEP